MYDVLLYLKFARGTIRVISGILLFKRFMCDVLLFEVSLLDTF